MPELPEVETIVRQLAPELSGARIIAAEVLDPRFTRPQDPAAPGRLLPGRRIERVERRGKYAILRLEGGLALVLHLRMTGNLLLRRAGGADLDPAPPLLYEGRRDQGMHLRARFILEGGRELWFTDARRFGHGHLLVEAQLRAYLDERLGPEPLSGAFTPTTLAAAAAGRSAPLKSFLLDQRTVAGIGNIYADEALHRAGLHPLSPAGSMREPHHEALHAGIVDALRAGIAHGGASIDDYRDAKGGTGSMQEELLVHRREGLPCARCGEPVRRVVVAGRSTYFCAGCQTRLRRRPRRRSRALERPGPAGAP